MAINQSIAQWARENKMSINNREFKKLLAQGCIAELSVVRSINNIEFNEKNLNLFCDYIDCTDDVPTDYHCDLMLQVSDRSDGFSPTCNETILDVEVKSAANGGAYKDHSGEKTFFAEIIQTGTNGYPEYLVTPVDFIVYVDTKDNTHYWYDGSIFAEKVKSRYYNKFPIALGTAEGIKFSALSKDYGFMYMHKAQHTLTEIVKENHDHIIGRINRKKVSVIHKNALGLPTLN